MSTSLCYGFTNSYGIVIRTYIRTTQFSIGACLFLLEETTVYYLKEKSALPLFSICSGAFHKIIGYFELEVKHSSAAT